MLDTRGPEIRTRDLANELNLVEGSEISISVRGLSDVEETSIHVDYIDLIRDFNQGDRITVDNGLINLEVLKKQDRAMCYRVLDGEC